MAKNATAAAEPSPKGASDKGRLRSPRVPPPGPPHGSGTRNGSIDLSCISDGPPDSRPCRPFGDEASGREGQSQEDA